LNIKARYLTVLNRVSKSKILNLFLNLLLFCFLKVVPCIVLTFYFNV